VNIVFLDAETVGQDISFEELERLGNFVKYDNTSPENVILRLQDADVAVVNKTRITAEIIEACPSIKLICVAATGTNNIDHDAAAKAGVTVKNVAGYSTGSVVQLTYGILFALMMHIPWFDSYVKSGEYSRSSLFTNYTYSFFELSGKQIGIIGMGTIGKQSAEIGISFGATIAYYSTSGINNSAPYPRMELDELLKTSDIVLIHAPLNDNTRNLICAKQFGLMKPSALLVNAGRGHIVNETDLANAINSETIAGAALDVFSKEPLSPDNPLLNVKYPDRLILTPHIAWASIESRRRLLNGIAENISSVMGN
jgi:glycerate dehydrogenase